MKKLIIFLLLLTISLCYGLTKLDSLKAQLAKSKGRAQLPILDQIQKEYWDIYPKASLEYGEEALELARELNYRNHEVKELRNIALAHKNLEDNQKALQYFHQSLIKANEINDKRMIIDIQLDIAELHLDMEQASIAFKYVLNTEKLSKDIGFDQGIAISNYLMGDIYLSLGEINTANEHYQKAFTFFDENKNKLLIGKTYEKLGKLNLVRENLEKAEEYYKQCLIYYEQINNTEGLIRCYEALGLMMKNQGRKRSALEYYTRLYHYNQQIEIELNKSKNLYLYEYYTAVGNPKEALQYLDKYKAQQDSLRRFQEKQDIEKDVEENVEKIVSKIKQNYEKEKDVIQNQQQELQQDLTTKDKELAEKLEENIQKTKELKKLESKAILQRKIYEIKNQRKTEQIEILEAERELKDLKLSQKIRERNYLILSSAVFILLFLLLLINYTQKRKLTKTLADKNEYLTQLTTELMEKEKQLEKQAKTDFLTNLPNRTAMAEKLEYEKYRFFRSGNPFSLIIGDIDDFKNINDTHGHDFGDYVLKTIADLIRKSIRKQDICARWGGEEFLFLLPETTEAGSSTLAEKVRSIIASYAFSHKEKEWHTTMTFGTSEFRKNLTIDECLKQADTALYYGKKTGKNKIIRYSEIKHKEKK